MPRLVNAGDVVVETAEWSTTCGIGSPMGFSLARKAGSAGVATKFKSVISLLTCTTPPTIELALTVPWAAGPYRAPRRPQPARPPVVRILSQRSIVFSGAPDAELAQRPGKESRYAVATPSVKGEFRSPGLFVPPSARSHGEVVRCSYEGQMVNEFVKSRLSS